MPTLCRRPRLIDWIVLPNSSLVNGWRRCLPEYLPDTNFVSLAFVQVTLCSGGKLHAISNHAINTLLFCFISVGKGSQGSRHGRLLGIWAQGARAGDPLFLSAFGGTDPRSPGLRCEPLTLSPFLLCKRYHKPSKDQALHDTVTRYVTLTEQGSCSGCHTPVARALAARSLMNTARCADHRAVAIPERCTARQC
jgi:hypothetical protein